MAKVRPDDPAKLTEFKVLTFDVYSTLIDESTGMHNGLQPLLSRLPPTHAFTSNKAAALSAFSVFERALQVSEPRLPYNALLERAYAAFAQSVGLPVPDQRECATFGASIPTWPAFPDTVAALKRLKTRYKLVILSNIDNGSIQQTVAGPLGGVPFDAVYTAQEIGSYKPALQNFSYLIEHVDKDLGFSKGEILHTANSLRCDHVPAKEMGLTSVWIDRGDGEEELRAFEGRVGFTWRFATMGDMSEEVEAAFAKE